MEKSQLVIRGSRSIGVFNAFGSTCLVAFMAYEQRSTLFDWKHFNPNGMNSILFLLFSVFSLMCWGLLFYDPPRLKLDEDGIWKRRNFLSFSLVKKVSWENISYYYVGVEPDRTLTTEALIVRQKDPDVEIRIEITDTNLPKEKILDFIKQYSVKYGFTDLIGEMK